jgi:hypothetical protein
MPNLDSLLNQKFIYCILGVVFLLAAVISICAGTTVARYNGWVYRNKEPSNFWSVVAIYVFGGILCIGIYLHSISSAAILHPERWLQWK